LKIEKFVHGGTAAQPGMAVPQWEKSKIENGNWETVCHPPVVFVRVARKGVTETFFVRDVDKGLTRASFVPFAKSALGKRAGKGVRRDSRKPLADSGQ
jgi:hypothetical protein